MSKGLEALERLYCAGNLQLDYVCSNKHKEDYNIIEKELKEVSEEDRVILRHIKKGKLHPLTTKCYQDLLKKQKTLEFIKEKRVAINILFMSENADVYNELYKAVIIPKSNIRYTYEFKLTKEEYDLLKEVLL